MPKADDYLFTLDVCLRNLPANAHPAHAQRIRELKEMVQSQSVGQQNPEQLRKAVDGKRDAGVHWTGGMNSG